MHLQADDIAAQPTRRAATTSSQALSYRKPQDQASPTTCALPTDERHDGATYLFHAETLLLRNTEICFYVRFVVHYSTV